MTIRLSVIIPAYNEQSWIAQTLDAIGTAQSRLPTAVASEVILVDNGSVDDTVNLARSHKQPLQFRIEHCPTLGAARARNWGAHRARGDILIFVDADTLVPEDAFIRVLEHCDLRQYEAGMFSLGALDGGLRSRCWWFFWNQVRRLPLAKAKAMPALMFCTRAVFEELGPFDERVVIGEEWPILAGLYRQRPDRLIYDRTLIGKTSSRRMERQPFGYCRTFLKWAWAVVDFRGRVSYRTDIR
ncbi:MAG: glycosyltransferase [Planctomycetales bacterium]|nr:glycosyltransferase [Planctomycetales bacterium]